MAAVQFKKLLSQRPNTPLMRAVTSSLQDNCSARTINCLFEPIKGARQLSSLMHHHHHHCHGNRTTNITEATVSRLVRCANIKTPADYWLKTHGPFVGCHGYQQVRFAGHSHWQNVRHIKGAADAKRQQNSIRIRQKIRLAIRNGGGGDPKMNRDLARVLEEGRSLNLPLNSLMETVKKVTEDKDVGSELIMEATSILGNFYIVIECFTDKPHHVRKELKGVIQKSGGAVVSGRAFRDFDYKGVIYVVGTEDYTLDLERATEQAIEAGAEEVIEDIDCSGETRQPCLKFLCETTQLHQVRNSLADLGVPISDSRFEYIPHTFVKLKKEQFEMAGTLLQAIEAHSDVMRVYDNIDPESDS